MSIVWKSFKVDPTNEDWEPANYNVTWDSHALYPLLQR